MKRRAIIAICAVASLAGSSAVFAQQQQKQGDPSGPTAGAPVGPTTEENRGEGRSVETDDTRPGAGMPGTESGPEPQDDDEDDD